MADLLLSFSLLLNFLLCLVHFFNSILDTEEVIEAQNVMSKDTKSIVSSIRHTSSRSHTHSSAEEPVYTPAGSLSPIDECDNPECPANKGTDSTKLSPEQQIFNQLGTIKEILDSLPITQRERMNGFLGTLESRRFEEDLPTTYASLSRQNKETSESDVIRAYQQFKEYRFEEVAVDDTEDGDAACCDKLKKGTETGVDKILLEFARAREIRKKSHLIGTLLLEDALESMRERDKRLAFGRYRVDKPKRRQSMIDPNLDAIEEIATPTTGTPMDGSPFVVGIETPAREVMNPFNLDEDMGKGLAKRKMEAKIGSESLEEVEEVENEEEGTSFL